MSTNGLLDTSRLEVRLGDYGTAAATALTDVSLHLKTQDFRRQIGARMYPLDKNDIGQKIPTADYHVSRKVDGEFTVLAYDNGHVLTVNPGGLVRVGLPWMNEAAELLGKAGVKDALIAGELYVSGTEDRRPRVHDVTKIARQPRDDDELRRLHFAVFDIITLDGEPPPVVFDDTWRTIVRIFGSGERVHPVETASAKGAADVERLFADWVEDQGAEGLVVRSDTAGLFKIKPRHTLDVAVIGFAESSDERQGMLHDLLLAVMRRDGSLHLLSRVGGGFSDDDRRALLADLKDMTAESEYAEVNAEHVAYQMVRPEWVIEISCLDLISQTTRGGPINRMVLDFNHDVSQYQVIRRLPLASVISPQFIRRREDKRVEPHDVRIDQVAEIVEVPMVDRDAGQLTLRQSELLRREVYTKQLRGGTMVRKFVMWKTNKEGESDEFPAYVVHFTDFSPNRQTPLSRDIRVSNSREQIESLWGEMKDANIKQGWDHWGAKKAPEAGTGATKKKAAAKKRATKKAPTKAATKKKARKKTTKKKRAKKEKKG